MINHSSNKKILTYLSLVMLTVWGCFSIVYFQFRLYGDVAHYLMELINNRDFFITHSRPSSVIIEWLPLMLVQLNQPITQVVLGLSLAELLYLACLTGVFLYQGKSQLSFFMLFGLLIGIRWNFFNPVSELVLAAPLVFFLPDIFKAILKGNKAFLSYTILLLVSLFLVFSHPLLIVILVLQLAFIGIEEFRNKRFITSLLLVLISFLVRWFYFDAYEKAPLQNLGSKESVSEILEKFTLIEHLIDLFKAYFGVIFLFGVLYFASDYRKKTLFRLLISAFVGMWVVLVVSQFSYLYPQTFEPFERYMFIVPLGLSLLASQVQLKFDVKIKSGFAVVILFHFFTLFRYANFVEGRYQFLDDSLSSIATWPERKVYIRKANYYPSDELPRIYGHDWILGNESVVRSSMLYPTRTQQVFIKELLDSTHLAKLQSFDFLEYYQDGGRLSKLNKAYFQLPDQPWIEANTDGDHSFLSTIKPGEIKGSWEDSSEIQRQGNRLVTVLLENYSGVIVHSGLIKGKLWLTLDWRNSEGESLKNMDVRTPLIVDLREKIKQRILIKYPDNKGEYLVRLVLLRESDNFLYPINEFIKVKVK